MTNKELLSQTINYLRFPLTIGVVLIHFNIANNGISVHGVQYGMNVADWYRYIVTFFSDVVARLSVPIFFMISGFLFFYSKDFNGSVYIKKLKTRVRTLLIPFILWNIIALLNQMIRMLPFFSSLFPNLAQTEFKFSLVRLFNTFFNNTSYNGLLVSPFDEIVTSCPVPINVPMWYVRDLMVIVLLTPFIYWCIRKMSYWYLIGLYLFTSIFAIFFYSEGNYYLLLLDNVFFFSWGAWYSINHRNLIEQMWKLRYAVFLYIPFAVMDLLTKEISINYYIHFAGIFLGIISGFVIVSYLLSHDKIKVNTTLANSSFFVFALHTLIISDLAKILLIGLHLPDTTLVMLLLYIIVPILTICICVMLYMFLRRYLPSLCGLLTGGR